ncbi:hypothetical protein EST38_g11146 [Candolleomyces aberdarensis]|uniref:Uncharacterized protein n=1 Tax=Candolleomyces aberdarensis TaxID=2316362 RepID=A0A4Q2D5L8_9AGAR|nr:hypothetical protein EST38_g11146 [Candolleomyces aberdarensis]
MSNSPLSKLLRLETESTEILISDLCSLGSMEKSDFSNTDLGMRHQSFSGFTNNGRPVIILHRFVPKYKDGPGSYLRLLYKSFSDFLDQESRAKDLFVPLTRVYEHLAKCYLLNTIESSDPDFLKEAADNLPIYWTMGSPIDDEIINFTQQGGWLKIDSVHAGYKSYYSFLLNECGPLTEGIKNRDPEVVAAMSTFLNRWRREYEDFTEEEYQKRMPQK